MRGTSEPWELCPSSSRSWRARSLSSSTYGALGLKGSASGRPPSSGSAATTSSPTKGHEHPAARHGLALERGQKPNGLTVALRRNAHREAGVLDPAVRHPGRAGLALQVAYVLLSHFLAEERVHLCSLSAVTTVSSIAVT